MVIETLYIDETHELDAYASKAFDMYFGDGSICVLDIETTGLAPGNSRFVLGSLLEVGEGGAANLKQYFAEDVSEERRLLAEYVQEASRHHVILTYNGKNFDVPFLMSRAEKLGLDGLSLPHNLDLYLVLNGHSALRKILPNLKQKTVEDFMGLWPHRADRISGADSARLYLEYMHFKEAGQDVKERVELMLLHNRDDVLQLGKLLPVLEKADLHKAMSALGFPVASGGRRLTVTGVKFDGNRLKALGVQRNHPVDYISYGSGSCDCAVRFEKRGSTFELSFPLLRKAGAMIMDLLELPPCAGDGLSSLPGYGSGYIVLKDGDGVKHLEANRLIRNFLLMTINELPEVREQ